MRREPIFPIANPHQTAAPDANYHVNVAVAFKAGIAFRFQLEVPEMKRGPLTALANQHLARRTGEFAGAAGRNLVRLNLGVLPTEISSQTPQYRWRPEARGLYGGSRRCHWCRCARHPRAALGTGLGGYG